MAELNEGRHKTYHCSDVSLMARINTIARPGRIKSVLYELAYASKPWKLEIIFNANVHLDFDL